MVASARSARLGNAYAEAYGAASLVGGVLSTAQRTVLYEADGEGTSFRVERWFVPLPDSVHECVTRIALVWDTPTIGEQVALLGVNAARKVARHLADFVQKEMDD